MPTLSEILGGGLTTAATLALGQNTSNNLNQAASQQQQTLQAAGDQARSDLQFKPFTVTTPTSTINASQSGIGIGLSPQETLLQQLGLSSAADFLSGANATDPTIAAQQQQFNNLFGDTLSQYNPDITGASNDILAAMNAAQAPEIERARLGLEERLAGQGRLGLQTAQFGGSPEALAMEKAIAEQQANNAVTARSQALGEQQQLFSNLSGFANQGIGMSQAQQGLQQGNQLLGSNFLTAGYAPQNQALNALGAGTNIANIGAGLQQQAGTTAAQLAGYGAESVMQGQQLGTEFNATLLSQLLQNMSTPQGADGSGGTQITNTLDWLTGLFGGGGSSSGTSLAPDMGINIGEDTNAWLAQLLAGGQ